MNQSVLKYNVIFEKQEIGGYTVTVPSLPGCISEGDTFEEAETNITDAIKLFLEDLEADGEDIPAKSPSIFVGQVSVSSPLVN